MGRSNTDTLNGALIETRERLSKKQNEILVLQNLATEFAMARVKEDLLAITRNQLRSLLPFLEMGVGTINDDGYTMSPFIFELDGMVTTHPRYQEMLHLKYPLNDGVCDRVLDSPEPVMFNLREMAEKGALPEFLQVPLECGVTRTILTRLCTGDREVGIMGMNLAGEKPLSPDQIGLIKYISHLMAIAVSDVQANEDIQRRQLERETLLSLSTDITSARTTDDLMTLVQLKLRKLLGFSHTGMTSFDKEQMICKALVLDPESPSKSHPEYKEACAKAYPVHDGAGFEKAFVSSKPVVFDLSVLAKQSNCPMYARVPYERGAKMMCINRLCHGTEIFGFWFLYYYDEEVIDDGRLRLIEGLSNQLSVAVSNILANEDIQRRQVERETLLSLNTDISSARTTTDLMTLIRGKLVQLLGFSTTGMTSFNKEKMTCTPFCFDPHTACSTHPEYKQAATEEYPINDGLALEKAFASDKPVVFSLKDLFKPSGTPRYVTVAYECGLKTVCISRLCHGGEILGFWFAYYNAGEVIDEGRFRLIEGLSNQLSVALSNILANEDIERRQMEKETLLSLSIDIAAVRTADDLMTPVRLKLKKILRFTNTGMSLLDKDKMVCTPLMPDPQSTARNHPDYNRGNVTKFSFYDGIFETAFASDKPMVFSLKDLAKNDNVPLYVKVPYESGLKLLCISRLCHRGEVLGFWLLYYENDHVIDEGSLRLIEGLSNQLSVAVANILANEVIARNLQAVSHQKQQLKEEKIYLMEEIAKSNNSWDIVGKSNAMQAIFQLVRQVAQWDSTVLIQGETGTGKELIARAIHNHSPRRQKMMVKVNCAALPANLIESELFGHERGSFTGAFERRIGKFELAHDGTLFLDEVGELPLELQAKLLRALQEKEIERVGGKTTIKVNVRIVAATNRDLEKEMSVGRFRSDLFYRLNIFPIQLPPLRERKEDIPILAAHFIEFHAKKIGRRIEGFNSTVLQELVNYDWPGNIRELENLLERSVLLASGDTIQKVNLPSPKGDSATHSKSETPLRLQSLADNEKQHILSVLKYCGERISGKDGAAVILGIPSSTLISRMKRLGIKKEHT